MGNENVSLKPHNPADVHTVEVLNRRRLSKTTFEIELSRPRSFEFKAGQTIRLIHQSVERYYSLVSIPTDPIFKLCVQNIPGGQFSPILAHAEKGFQVQMTGPHGYFTFKPSNRIPVMISTGTGVAPFVSFARSGITGFIFFQQAASQRELYYRSDFQGITLNHILCLPGASAAENPMPELFRGRISDCVRKYLPRGRYDFYLCGERRMIRDVTLLIDEVYRESRVYTEVFY
jgi:ferredoxin-NADP reductase